MKKHFKTIGLISIVILASCSRTNQTDLPVPTNKNHTESFKTVCVPVTTSTMDQIMEILESYVDDEMIPANVPGIIVNRNTLATALKKENVENKIGIFFMQDAGGQPFFYCVGRKNGIYSISRLPKLGVPGTKCCPFNLNCCLSQLSIKYLCIDDCPGETTGSADSLRQVLGAEVVNLTIPNLLPGVATNKKNMISALTDTCNFYHMQQKIGLFLLENQDSKKQLWIVSRNMSGNTVSIKAGALQYIIDICCPQLENCCSVVTKLEYLCED